MLGIGQFAQLAKVSVRTLRYYGDHGLLHASHVDPSSGYRSYDASQLADLNRILVMKDLGLTLDEIKTFLEESISVEELITLAEVRQAEAEERFDVEQQRLNRVAVRLSLLQGTTMSSITSAVVIKPLDPMRLATAREVVSGFDADLGATFGRLYPRIYGELGRLGVDTSMPTAAMYEEHDEGIEVIAGVQIPIDAEFTSKTVGQLDVAKVERAATLVHNGGMETVGATHQTLVDWVTAAAETLDGFTRELYLQHDGPQDTWVTELQAVLVS